MCQTIPATKLPLSSNDVASAMVGSPLYVLAKSSVSGSFKYNGLPTPGISSIPAPLASTGTTCTVVLGMTVSAAPALGVAVATLMALQGNWFAVAPAVWAIVGPYAVPGLLIATVVDSVVSRDASALLVATAGASLATVTSPRGSL